MFSTETGGLRACREEHGNWGIAGSQRGQAGGGGPGRLSSAGARRKPRAWLVRAEGKFQSLEAVPWGRHRAFSLGFIKQTITKQPSANNNNKNHPEVGVFRNKINNMEVVYFVTKEQERISAFGPC